MYNRYFEKTVWLVLAALAATLGVILLAGSRIGLPPPQLAAASRGEISGRGVIGLTFAQRMQPGSVEARLSVDPAVQGSFRWEERTVWFHPQQPLLAGQAYSLKLESGAESEDGRTIRRAASWRVQVRQPWVVYLSPVTSGADLWRSLPDGSVHERLTHTGGKVINFAIAFDGERIVFSAVNAQGGADLWLVDRTGEREKILLECATDWCTDLDWSPDGKRIVFVRSGSPPSPGGEPRRGRLWLFDFGSRLAAPFQADEGRTGFDPSWSPDGRRLAFADGTGAGIRVVDLQTNREFLLPTNQGVVGAWSPDGRQILFTNAPAAFADQMYNSVFLADFETEEIRPLLNLEGLTVDVSLPVWSPDGEWLAAGLQVAGSGLSKQLWLMRLDGSGQTPITDNPVHTHAAYRWDASGQAVAFQRLQLGSSLARPEVVIWQRRTGDLVVVAQDAGMPAWLP